jgi:tetratricopeptide (TPR) repeat protein
MNTKYPFSLIHGLLLIGFITLAWNTNFLIAAGRPGGGGGKGSGGGGARASMGRVSAPAARPASRPTANVSRPNVSRPNPGAASRPSFSNAAANRPAVSKPAQVQRPSLGPATKPGGNVASRPGSVARPTPGIAQRPGNNRPNISNRPSVPGTGNITARPGIGNTSRPTTLPATNRPSIGGGSVNRPSIGNIAGGNRPTTLPGNLPGAGNRPNIGDRPTTLPGNLRPGGGNRPGIADRPTTLPGNLRPGGGERPGIVDRPTTLPGNLWPGDRPIIGGGNRPGPGDRPIIGGGNRPGPGDRPIIGGGNWPGGGNRPIIGGGNNNNIVGGGNTIIGGGNNFVNINNRPGWGYGSGGGYWGGEYGHWGNQWCGNHIGSHYGGWYHGCWAGHWGDNWYVPLAYGATVWGVNSLLPAWGYSYGYSYANPYYVPAESSQPVYDYSQPIVINTYNSPSAEVTSDDDQAPVAQVAQATPEQAASYQLFDQAREAFSKGDYRSAQQAVEQAIRKSPKDPVLHEFNSLCLFALGDYQRAAGVLNSLLAVAPGMDWTTMSALYPDIEVYTQQLRSLEKRCQKKPDDAAAQFVLAYHYLVAGHSEAAADALKKAVAKQPSDMVAKQLLESLAPASVKPMTSSPPTPSGVETPAAEAPTTDLVGNWKAERNGNVFELTIDENGKFVWKATPKGKPPLTIDGNLTATNDTLILESKDQGSMVGNVTPGGPDKFQFISTGSPPGDTGLTFKRS